ncbi:MAG: hypothetical protein BJBARM5_1099, partial [Candidatus Parvarchaeum acidophilus ARMAN-5]
MLDDVLTKDHDRIDSDLKEFLVSLSSNADKDKLLSVKDSLKNHMFWEEEYLFPSIIKGNELRIKGLEAEHGSIIKLLDEVLKQLSLNDKNEAIKKTEAVLRVIKGHNETEEGYIYIGLDRLDPKKQAELMLEGSKACSR